jgi:hypothetical protein
MEGLDGTLAVTTGGEEPWTLEVREKSSQSLNAEAIVTTKRAELTIRAAPIRT